MPKVPARQTSQLPRQLSTAIDPGEGVCGEAKAIPDPASDEWVVGNPRTSRGPPELEPLVVSPKVAKYLLGIGTTKLWELIRAGELESFLDGASRRITLASIKARVARQLATAQAVDGTNRRGSIQKAVARSISVRRARGVRASEAIGLTPGTSRPSKPTEAPATRRSGAPVDGGSR
jgi:hypothetical protein